MSEMMDQSGFIELQHTADRAILVWAPTLDELFLQAAQGMYHIMGLKTVSPKQYYRNISLSAADQEGLLVSFLSELLYLLERDRLFFTGFEFSREEESLWIRISGMLASDPYSEIKAVTYNDLQIQHNENEYKVRIVFDV